MDWNIQNQLHFVCDTARSDPQYGFKLNIQVVFLLEEWEIRLINISIWGIISLWFCSVAYKQYRNSEVGVTGRESQYLQAGLVNIVSGV